MTRPASIHQFENLWWGATAAWLVGTTLSWTRAQRNLLADPRTAPVADYAQLLVVMVVIGVTALLWWLTARRASRGGKWVVTALAVVGGLIALGRLAGLALGRTPHVLSLGAFLLSAALTIAASAALFRPEADAWFARGEQEPLP